MKFFQFIQVLAISCLLLFLSSTMSFAQNDDLINNPNIRWAAEFSADHSFDLNGDSYKEMINLLKLYNPSLDMENANRSEWLIDQFFQGAFDGFFECYKDPGLTQRLSDEEVISFSRSIDTVITFNPETFEETISIVWNDLSTDRISHLRVNQVIYYLDKPDEFKTRLNSFAFLVPDENENMVPLYWIKMNQDFPSNFDIHSPDIIWGALAYSKAHPLELNFMQEIKNLNKFDFQKTIYDQANNLSKPIESIEGYGSNIFLTEKDINPYYNSIDTVITFNPETFEETIQIIKNDLRYSEISQYRLVQEWYYDAKKRKLFNRLRAIAPIVNVSDESGKYKYSKPLYYIRYAD